MTEQEINKYVADHGARDGFTLRRYERAIDDEGHFDVVEEWVKDGVVKDPEEVIRKLKEKK